MSRKNRYSQIIERIFLSRYRQGATEVEFEREDIVEVARALGIDLPKNLGDVIYSFRYRAELPTAIRDLAPEGKEWIIRPAGKARYCFVATSTALIEPSQILAETKVPDATPGIIAMYALSDEQALLAKLRYNRLIDIFTGITSYSLQNHLRTFVRELGQVETDDVYVGLDRKGIHYVIPVQAKSGKDTLNVVQVEQDFALCRMKFPAMTCRPIGAKFMGDDLIALFEFEKTDADVAVVGEKHYRLVPLDDLSREELLAYRSRLT